MDASIFCSVMENLSILESTITIWMLNISCNTLWLLSTLHESNLIHFIDWFEKIRTTVVEELFELIIALVIEETIVIEMSFVNLNWTSIVAKHEFLEREETNVPTITFFIRNELGHCSWIIKLWTSLELPDASINITESEEWSPVFVMFWFVSWEWHLSNV